MMEGHEPVDGNERADIELVNFILERHASLKKIRADWEPTWEEIMEMILPNYVSALKDTTVQGRRGDTKIFNGHGNWALNTLTRGLLGHTVTADMDWISLMQTDRKIRLDRDVQEYSLDVIQAMLSVYRNSNFYYTNEEYIRNAAGLGTSGILIEADMRRKSVVYSARHIGEIYIDEDNFGFVDTIHREFRVNPRQLMQMFGRENVPEAIRQRDRSANSKADIKVVHAIYPNYDQIPGNQSFLGMPFRSYYVIDQPKSLLAVGGFNTWPIPVLRWEKLSNEVYGRCPGYNALQDFKGLQRISKSNIMQAQYAADPARSIPIEMKGKTKIVPGGNNYYVDAQRQIGMIQSQGQYQIGLEQEQKKTEIIDKHFMVDMFTMLMQIDRMMTATETERRVGEQSAIIGPVITRMQKEGYDLINQRTYDLAGRLGKLPDMPPILEDYMQKRGESPYQLEYIGNLFKLQKRTYEMSGFNQFFEQMGAMSQVVPGAQEEFADSIHWRRTIQQLSQSNNMETLTLNTDDEYAELKQQRAQQQQQLMEQQQMESMGRAANGLNSPVKEGSVFESMLGG